MYTEYENQRIEVRVKNIVIDGTRYGQVAKWRGFSAIPHPVNQQLAVAIALWVDLYSLRDDDSIGELLSGRPGITGYKDELVADDKTAVYFDEADPRDPRTGKVLSPDYVRQNESRVSYLERLRALPEPVRLQCDFYNWMLFNAPVIVAPLIVDMIHDADNNPLFPHFVG